MSLQVLMILEFRGDNQYELCVSRLAGLAFANDLNFISVFQTSYVRPEAKN